MYRGRCRDRACSDFYRLCQRRSPTSYIMVLAGLPSRATDPGISRTPSCIVGRGHMHYRDSQSDDFVHDYHAAHLMSPVDHNEIGRLPKFEGLIRMR